MTVERFATNPVYSVQGDAYDGLPNKSKPSTTGFEDGFRPDTDVSVTELNWLLNQQRDELRGDAALQFHEVETGAGAELTTGLVSTPAGHYLGVNLNARLIGSATSLYRDVTAPTMTNGYALAFDPNTERLVMAGFHATNMVAYSDNYGFSWSYATDVPNVFYGQIVWDDTNGLFIMLGSSGAAPYITTSATAANATWTTRTPGTLGSVFSKTMAHYEGITIRDCYQATTAVVIDLSTDGTTWNTHTIMTAGYGFARIMGLAVDETTGKFIAAIKDSASYTVEIWSSPLTDGTTWAKETETELTKSGAQGQLANEVMKCTDTGRLVLAGMVTGTGSAGVFYSDDLGSNWTFVPLYWVGNANGSDEFRLTIVGSKISVGIKSGTYTTSAAFINLI